MIAKARRVLGNIRLHREEGTKTRGRQLWEILLLALKHRLSPVEYEAYGFFRREKTRAQMNTYLSNYEVTVKLRRPLYDGRFLVILNNKLLFNRFFSSFGLPLPELYGFLNPDSGFLPDGSRLTSREELAAWLARTGRDEMFIKPVGGLQGFNALIIQNTAGGKVLCGAAPSGEWTAEELYDHLFRDIPAGRFYFSGYIFEERIRQHPALSRLNASSVNTCRILTIKKKDGSVITPCAYIRLGKAGSTVDNFSQGGVAAAVDMQTGILKQGTFNPRKGLSWTTVHPDSGAAIQGFQVPHWEKVKELARRAAAVIPGIRTVGWDVAITEGGTCLIEGNSSWNPITLQQVNGGLLTPENREIFRQYDLHLH